MRTLSAGLSGAGLLLSMIAIFLVLDARAARTTESQAAAPVRDRGIEELRSEVELLRAESRRMWSTLRTDAGPPPSVPEETGAEPGPRKEPDEASAVDLLALGRKVVATRATPEETGRFWKLARTPGLVDELIAEIEEEVADSPRDAEARMRLADAYVVKLFTVPPGPEMGLWGGKAEGQWREVLKLDPSHWQARFNLAVSLSYHPDVSGKTPEAIRELSHLVEQQESMAPEPVQGDVYRLLAILHQRQGDREEAERTLRRGLERHPGDAKLKKALEEGRR